MGPSTVTTDPIWVLMLLFTLLEALVVLTLIMPMPSNVVRGQITQAVADAWAKSEYVRKSTWIVLTLNLYFLYDAVRTLHTTSNVVEVATCETRAATLLLERNAYICGFSIFLFCVMQRLLDIQGQLFQTRMLVKRAALEAADGEGAEGSGGSAAALRALERAVSRVVADDGAGAAVRSAASKQA